MWKRSQFSCCNSDAYIAEDGKEKHKSKDGSLQVHGERKKLGRSLTRILSYRKKQKVELRSIRLASRSSLQKTIDSSFEKVEKRRIEGKSRFSCAQGSRHFEIRITIIGSTGETFLETYYTVCGNTGTGGRTSRIQE